MLWAIPLALLAVVVLEVLRMPAAVTAASAQSPLAALLLGLRAALDFLWAPTLFQLYLAAMAACRSPTLRTGALSWLLGTLVAGAICAFSYVGLTAYGPFRGYLPFIALFAVLFVFLLWWTRVLLAPPLPSAARGVRRALRWGLPFVGLVGFGITTILNRTLYPDAYPTLHLSILQVSYLLLLVGLSSLLVVLPPRSRRPRVLRWLAAGAFVNVVVLAPPLVDGGLCDALQPAFRRFTDLGRSYALRPGGREPASVPGLAPAAAVELDDAAALARFAAHSNLPQLPSGFDLTRYNVLVVSVDAFRYRETGLHEGRPGVTPSLFALAQRGGYWFERAYSPAPATLQSFSSLFAMSYPSMLRLSQDTPWHGKLSEKETTVATLFRAAGYRTFYAGHNFRLHHGHGAKIRGLLQGFDDLRLAPGGERDPYNPHQDAIILAGAKAALEAHRGKKERFFGWVFFESPHAPYLTHYDDLPGATEHERYRQEVRYVDEQLGALFAELERTGVMNETVVILLSDHGEGFGLHERRRHADVYSEITEVPLAVFVPGAPGRRIKEPTSTLYLFPWLLQHGTPAMREAATARLRTHLGPMLKHTEGAIVSELRCNGCSRTALVYPEHRLIYDYASGYVELYERASDPDEQRNVFDAASPRSQEFLRRLAGYLRVSAAAKQP